MKEREELTVKGLALSIAENLQKIKPQDSISAQALEGAVQDLVRLWNLIGFPHCPGPGLRVFP
jgi:hypothetical protein